MFHGLSRDIPPRRRTNLDGETETGNGEIARDGEVMTSAEAAQYLGLNVRTVQGAIATGQLRARKVTPAGWSPLRQIFLISKADVLHYQAEHRGVRRPGGNYRISDTERADMEARGFMTIKDAALLVGITPQALLNRLQVDQIPTEKRAVLWVERINILSIKRERDRKIARIGMGAHA